MNKVKIELAEVTKQFGDVTAVNNISLKIETGKIFSLLGPSGCGKTTLLRMIAGFESPTRGSIFIDGKDFTSVQPYKRNLGMFFQSYALFPHKNVFENIAYGLKMRKVIKSDIKTRVNEALQMVQLEGFGKRKISQLSGGQQQRVALARAIIINPTALLLDEPLSNLDKKLREEMQVHIKNLHEEIGITTVFVTHNQEESIVISDQIVVIKDGRIMQIGTPYQVYHEPENLFVANFIGTANIASATLEREEKGMKIFRLGKNEFVYSTSKTEGKLVNIICRPESLSLSPATTMNTSYMLHGVVEKVINLGSRSRYYVKLSCGNIFIVEEQGDAAEKYHEPGEKIKIGYNPEKIWVICDD